LFQRETYISHIDDPSWNEECLSTEKECTVKKYSTTNVLTGATKNSQKTQNTYSFDLTGGDELPVVSNPRIKRTPKKIPDVPAQSKLKKIRIPALDLVVESNDLKKINN
jgi:hypothetical protein